jgi:hypothetical protein
LPSERILRYNNQANTIAGIERKSALNSNQIDLERIKTLRAVSIALIGFATGILSGLLGIGGGTILVPAMVYLLGMRQHRAHGTSLAAMSAVVISSTLLYSRHGQVDWIIAVEMAVGGVIGAAVGARIACRLKGRTLRRYFGLFLILVAVKMLYDASTNIGAQAYAGPLIPAHQLAGGLLVVLVGITAGILSGLLGVGGGIIMIPAMVLLLGLGQKLAQGISLAVIIPVSISGAMIHARHGNVSSGVAVPLAVGGIAGGLIGARVAVGLDPLVLRSMFGILMLIMGALMLIRRQAPSPPSTETQDEIGTSLGG